MSTDATATNNSQNSSPPQGGFRWQLGLGLLAVCTLAELAVWNLAPDRTYQVFFSMPVLSASALLLVLWWLFFSGLAWRARITGIVAAGLLLLGFRVLVRFEGFDGDMFPRFAWRSSPTREQRLEEFLSTAGSDRVETQSPGAVSPHVASVSRPGPDAGNPAALPESSNTVEGNTGAEQSVEPLLITDRDWPAYRGAERDGVIQTDLSHIDWRTAPQEVWRHPIGAGWSSFAVVGGLAFTQEQRGPKECVVCYDIETGRQIWEHSDDARFEEALGGVGPRATPTVFGGRVYSLGATGLLNCLEARTGQRLWQQNILSESGAKNLEWAMAGSPFVSEQFVIVNPGGAGHQALLALNPQTGERKWAAGSDQASYTAPRVVTLLETPQVLLFDGKGMAGHALSDGKPLWRLDWENDPKVNAAIPVVVNDHSILMASGYGLGSALVTLKREGDQWSVSTAWKSRHFRLKFNPAVRDGDFAWALDEGILGCLNLKDGTQPWKKGRYGYGQLLLAGSTLIVQAESGDVAFVRASPEKYEELVRFPALTDKTWNLPVVWRDLLLVRNAAEVVCFRLKLLKVTAGIDR